MSIHPTALVDPKAELDSTVEVRPFALIGPQVRIAAGAVVGPHVVIDGRTEIGEGAQIFSGAQVGVLSQDLKHNHDFRGRCTIGRDTIIREHVSISASTVTSQDDEDRVTSVGERCLFMAYSHVGHDCHVGNQVWMANCASLAGHVEVEDGAILGGLTGVHQEVCIGRLAFIGGMSRVAQDVPPYMIVEGNPAHCHGPNVVGLRRNNIGEVARAHIKQMYRIMWRSGLNTSQALAEIESAVPESPERKHFVEFYRRSIRGVTK